jgi:TetR/AcrR family transcriptional regulator, cholesterol catabolism regulator
LSARPPLGLVTFSAVATDQAKQPPRSPGGRFTSNGRFEERRAQLAATAAKLFAERGYHATSMADLTEAAGLKRGGIYHYIDTKSDLLLLIHEEVIKPLADELREIEKRKDPPAESVRALAQAFLGSIANRNEEVRVFLHEQRAIQDRPEWKEVRSGRRQLERVVERVLQRGVDEGVFAIEDVRLAALGFLNMMNHSYTWFDPAGRWPATRIADSFCDVFLSGIQR